MKNEILLNFFYMRIQCPPVLISFFTYLFSDFWEKPSLATFCLKLIF